jgi:hypothetical protein
MIMPDRGIRRCLRLVLVAVALLLITGQAVVADALDDAKAAGLIGERPDGFVAAVQPNPTPDIAALVKNINRKRAAAYERIADESGTPVEQVGALAAEKVRQQSPPGHYFMNPNGSWSQN